MSRKTNYQFNHVGVSVPDLDAAVNWYTEVLGFHQLRPNITLSRDEDPDGIIFRSKLNHSDAPRDVEC